jgi:hypothetical protein
VLEVVLDAVPRPDLLVRWIQRVREDLAQGLHRTVAP